MAGRALILGVNGQDGALLARRLAARGWDAHGAARQPQPRAELTGLIQAYHAVDLRDPAATDALLATVDPDVIFHVAAVHGAAGFQYEPVFQDVLAVNVGSVHTALEHLRRRRPDARLVYASSCKIFGASPPSTVSESTPKIASCLYSTAKIAACDLMAVYRRVHGVKAAALHLFNHESELRPPDYFIPKIAAALRAAKAGTPAPVTVRTLDFVCNWGSAEEYMDLAIDVAERAPIEEFVFGHPVTWRAREMVAAAFARHGLEASAHVLTEISVAPPPLFSVRLGKMKRLLGRVPSASILDVVDRMAAA